MWLRWLRIHLQCGRPGFDPWVGKIPWRRAWLPPPVFLPGASPWTEEPGRLQSMGSQSWTRPQGLSAPCCRKWDDFSPLLAFLPTLYLPAVAPQAFLESCSPAFQSTCDSKTEHLWLSLCLTSLTAESAFSVRCLTLSYLIRRQ